MVMENQKQTFGDPEDQNSSATGVCPREKSQTLNVKESMLIAQSVFEFHSNSGYSGL